MPAVGKLRLEKTPGASAHQAKRFVPCRLLSVRGIESQRCAADAGAETDIRQPPLAIDRDTQRHVGERHRRCVRWQHPKYTRNQALDREAEPFEHSLEEAVLLEAVAAAPTVDQLRLDRAGT